MIAIAEGGLITLTIAARQALDRSHSPAAVQPAFDFVDTPSSPPDLTVINSVDAAASSLALARGSEAWEESMENFLSVPSNRTTIKVVLVHLATALSTRVFGLLVSARGDLT